MASPFSLKDAPPFVPNPTGKNGVNIEAPNWKPYKSSKWVNHHFICYDGEGFDINGSHEYIYLSAYDGNGYHEVRNDKGLTSEQCLKFLLQTASKFSHGINVIYGGSYDANMMLRDVNIELLQLLHAGEFIQWRGYRIKYVPRKYFQVSATIEGTKRTNWKTQKKSIRLWDVIGFFQQSFISAIETWLDITDKTITKGKKSRKSFNANDMDFIMEYCQKELLLFEKLCQRLWECLNRAGIKLNRWDGAGAASTALLIEYGVYQHKGTPENQSQYYHLARAAYAGGRFELFMPGDFRCKVYNYDINSAYPYGMSQLPGFERLEECTAKKHDKCIGKFDLLQIEYSGDYNSAIHPYFHRDHDYSISYPIETRGWHWAPEYTVSIQHGNNDRVLSHFKYISTNAKPFDWVPALYTKRRALKASGDRAELALKLALNALYGKLVQQKGWKPGKPIPKSHQLYWGGWITALTRSMIYDALMQNPDAMIATETDGIFSLAKLDVPLGKGLGEWDVKEYDDFTYVQSGMYFGTLSEGYYDPAKPETKNVVRYRGLDQGTLKRTHILKGWEKFEKGGTAYYKGISTRFRTIGTSLVGERFKDWRQWKPDKKKIALLPMGKRLHNPMCTNHWGIDGRHTTISIQPKTKDSVPYNVLWEDTEDKLGLFEIFEEEYEGIVSEG